MKSKRTVLFSIVTGILLATAAVALDTDSIRAAAERGDPTAQTTLGALYRHGMGVPQSDQEAARWYLKAANQGDAGAQSVVGVMYMQGQGVEKDEVQAKSWLRKAAAQGDTTAQRQLEFLKKPVKE
ncbi:MAG: sel1 repeat family protein [Magnetococcus sp. YQC-3]